MLEGINCITRSAAIGRYCLKRSAVRRCSISGPAATKATNALSALKPSDSVVDINRLSSNDINAVLVHYGVEAARMCIVRELRAVFDAYGIGVDVRHLYLGLQLRQYLRYESPSVVQTLLSEYLKNRHKS
ncbi:hypothetical protein EBU02_03175 [bacterium]|nr:hypothetical protein [bacterium]